MLAKIMQSTCYSWLACVSLIVQEYLRSSYSHARPLQVCSTILASTTPTPSQRQRRQADANQTMDDASGSGALDSMDAPTTLAYLDRPTQFIVMRIGEDSTNSAPQLRLPPQPIAVTEDATLEIQLEHEDAELDLVDFELLTISKLGNVTLTLDGFLTFDPCLHCTGTDMIEISIRERPFGENITPLEDFGQLVFQISSARDSPLIYFYNNTIGGSDDTITQDLVVNAYIDSNRSSPAVVASIAALDFDGYNDDLRLDVLVDGENGRVGFQTRLDAVSVLKSLPLTIPFPSPELTQYRDYLTFLASHVTYLPSDPSFVGNDTVTFAARDSTNIRSSRLQILIEVLPSPCLNGGVCGGSDADPDCEDIGQRRRGFEGYNCTCLPGFSGEVCEVVLTTPEPLPMRGKHV